MVILWINSEDYNNLLYSHDRGEVILCYGSQPSDYFLPKFEWLDHAEVASTGFMDASGGVLPEGYGHGAWRLPGRWPGGGLSEDTGMAGLVCLGDGQTEAEGVPSQNGRGDALLRRMPLYMTFILSLQCR